MSVLIITNGDSVAETLRVARPEAEILPWRDALHDGPVRDLPPDAFRAERAAHLADGVVNTEDSVRADLEARDATVARHGDYERLELWFEHDLYDQLQLIQVLDALAEAGRDRDISLIQAPRHLGPVPPHEIRRFESLALPVETPFTDTARRVWSAFRQPDPVRFAGARKGPIAGLPFLGASILRMLQEFPGPDGLSRTERQILYSINRGVDRPGPLFARVLNMEEAAFLGDWSFFSILSGLAFAEVPLVTGLPERFLPSILEDGYSRKAFITAPLKLTGLGADVLAGRTDRASQTSIDRWVGGTHLTADNLWRWNDERGELVSP